MRDRSLIEKGILLYRDAYNKAKILAEKCQDKLQQELAQKKAQSGSSANPAKGLLFVVVAIILLPALVFFFYMVHVASMLFSALIIWRGLKFRFHVPFPVILSEFFGSLGADLAVVLSPFTWILDQLAKINIIDFSLLQVTCQGSQAPLQLLFNLLVLGVVVVTIESGLFTYWSTMQMAVNGYILNQVYVHKYFRSELGMSIWKYIVFSFYLLSSYGLAYVDPIFRFLQYMMGFVNISHFDSDNGAHPYTQNCGSYDVFLAIISTIASYYMLALAFFVLAQVFVPGK